MKRGLLVLSFLVGFAPGLFAQNDHVQAGVYADYFRLSQTKTNFAGVGARLGFRLQTHHARSRNELRLQQGLHRRFY